MNPRAANKRSALRIVFTLIICVSLFPVTNVALLVSTRAQQLGHGHSGRQRPGRPEGLWPNLDHVQNESMVEREAPPPIPSTMRSPRVPFEPWDGRRVGDPEPQRGVGHAAQRGQTQRAHTRRRASVPRPCRDGNTVSYWDHPGTLATGTLGYFTKRNFNIKAYNGDRHCEVAFHLTFRVFSGRMIDAGWGADTYK